MLDYDNSAFYYFMISMMAIYMIPGWIFVFQYVVRSFFPHKRHSARSRSALEKKALEKRKSNEMGLKRLTNTTFLINVGILIVVSALFLYLVFQVSGDSEIAQFDPYKILGIDRDVTDKEIKRAYKVKALEYHPDKNIGDKMAEEMFMRVAKAYEALTDETAKENWKLYGNPDGKQSLEVSIGLPTFLLDKDNHDLILICYLVFLVIVIPVIVGIWYSRSRKYGGNGVLLITYEYFGRLLKKTTSLSELPEVFAAAMECRTINRVENEAELVEVEEVYKMIQKGPWTDGNFMAKAHPQLRAAQFIDLKKGNLILHGHLARKQLEEDGKELPPAWGKQEVAMLKLIDSLTGAMLDICLPQRFTETAVLVMKFSQFLTQGLWPRSKSTIKDQIPFLQLPHFTHDTIKQLPKITFRQYIKFSRAERKGLDSMSDQEQQDVHNVCDVVPNIDVKVSHFVYDEEEIAENDTVTVKVEMVRNHVPEGTKDFPVHAPHLPMRRDEGWWIILLEATRRQLITLEKMAPKGHVAKQELRFRAPERAGIYKFKVLIISNSYIGLDEEHDFDMKVISADELPEYKEHEEDIELDNEMSLFEGMMGNSNIDSDASSDEEDEQPKARSPSSQQTVSAKEKSSTERQNGGLTESQMKKRAKRLAKKGNAAGSDQST